MTVIITNAGVSVDIAFSIEDEDLMTAGLDPELIDIKELAEDFESILQEDYFFKILHEAGDPIQAYARRVRAQKSTDAINNLLDRLWESWDEDADT